jgi:hypothetical protein
MRRALRRRPSAALVIASLALIVALGGTSYAALKLPPNSIGAKQLKKNAVSSAKVKNGSLLRKDFRNGQIPQGPQGPQGLPGQKGDPGASGATNVTVRLGAASTRDSTAECNPGERAVGGGGFSSDGLLYDSSPSATGGTPTDWNASAEQADGSDATVQAYVICAAP